MIVCFPSSFTVTTTTFLMQELTTILILSSQSIFELTVHPFSLFPSPITNVQLPDAKVYQYLNFPSLNGKLWPFIPRPFIHTLRVMSSEQEANRLPWGSHLMALTSLVCPWNDLMGLSWPSWHTWMHWSVEQEAKEVLVCQSTSRAGAEWKANCCVQWPEDASQMMVVLCREKCMWQVNIMKNAKLYLIL